VLISSLLALVYTWRVVEVAFFRDPPAQRTQLREAPPAMILTTWVMVAAVLYFGVATSYSAGLAAAAARSLLEQAP
jgi:multicomponent Na+:H+ antiporter subunit D